MSKTTAQKADSSTDTDNYGAVVTHTTATIVGRQKAVVNVHAAATDDAQMIVTFNRLMMTFRSAAAVHAFGQRATGDIQGLPLRSQRDIRAISGRHHSVCG